MSEFTTTEIEVDGKKVIVPNFDNKVDFQPMKFSFKTQIIKDDSGEEIGKSKRPTVELHVPVPSVEGIVSIMEAGGKQLELLQEACSNVIAARAREIVNEREDVSQENFPWDMLTWEAIANIPAAEKRGRGIPKEVWEEFAADYIAVMPAATGKTPKQISNAAEILVDRFNKIKSNKDYKKIVDVLAKQLAIYMEASPNVENYMDCLSFLSDKANKILTAEEESLLEAL